MTAMAKTRIAPLKPQVSRGYFGIVFFTCIAMLAGIGLIVWEMTNVYEWKMPTGEKSNKVEPLPPKTPNAPAPKG